jgi:hypothetical protein
MKKNFFLSLLVGVVLLSSCKDFVSKDDISPNSPSSVPLAAQLPVADLAIFSTYGGAMARNQSMWVEQMVGVLNQSQQYGIYRIIETDISNDWQTLYSSGLVNTKEVIAAAGNANPYYKGTAQIQQALLTGIATDYWGDIPYREAALGVANVAPHYDAQEQVIGDIQVLLDSAIANFKKPESSNVLLPYNYDLIYIGKDNYVAGYIQTARILKARYYLRTAKRDPGAIDKALEAIASLEAPSSTLDAYMHFGPNGANNNQFNAFEANRQSYMRLSSYFVDTLKAKADPRLNVYASPVKGASGADTIYGSPYSGNGDASYIGSALASVDSPLPLVTYAEALFIKAEALARKDQLAEAQTAYQAAIRESMGRFPASITSGQIDTYVTANGTLTNDGIAQIMYEKYVHNFLFPEAWADWRRTGYPALTPNPDGVINQIPRRYLSEQRERINNPNATVISDLVTPVWWDKQ